MNCTTLPADAVWIFLSILFITIPALLQCCCCCKKKTKAPNQTPQKKGLMVQVKNGGPVPVPIAAKAAAPTKVTGLIRVQTALPKGGKKSNKSKLKTKIQRQKLIGLDPKFGAIQSDLVSYEDANSRLRKKKLSASTVPSCLFESREKRFVPPPSTKPAAAADEEGANEKRPEKGGLVNSSDYDTLNFLNNKQQDIFQRKGGDEEEEEGAAEAENKERKPDKGGMADSPDYETLNFMNQQDVFGGSKNQQNEGGVAAAAAATPVAGESAEEEDGKDQGRVERIPEEGGFGGTPEYETLNFMNQQDIFKGETAPRGDAEDDDCERTEVRKSGMAGTGDYETLADLNSHIFTTKK